MARSMYSLILMDEVVREIDRMAYQKRTSRSNLINQILAEYASYLTPEMRIRQIFEQVASTAAANQALQILGRPSANLLTMKSVINYKYNPTIRYSVEILTGEDGYRGEFRVLSRTQSESLLDRLTSFFLLWARVEQRLLAGRFEGDSLRHEVADGRFIRRLAVSGRDGIQDSTELGEAIGRYINLFDRAMDGYFTDPDLQADPDRAARRIAGLYQSYLKDAEFVI